MTVDGPEIVSTPLDTPPVSSHTDGMTSAQARYIASLFGDRWELALNAAARAGVINYDPESISRWQRRPPSIQVASTVIDWLKAGGR